VALDPRLQRKEKEERSEDSENIFIVDRGGSENIVDLVGEAKVSKQEHNC
jgi:hypothetical protein